MKEKKYELILQQLQALLEGEHDMIANMANMAALLFHELPDLNWAGFYLMKNNELVLGPFQGISRQAKGFAEPARCNAVHSW